MFGRTFVAAFTGTSTYRRIPTFHPFRAHCQPPNAYTFACAPPANLATPATWNLLMPSPYVGADFRPFCSTTGPGTFCSCLLPSRRHSGPEQVAYIARAPSATLPFLSAGPYSLPPRLVLTLLAFRSSFCLVACASRALYLSPSLLP